MNNVEMNKTIGSKSQSLSCDPNVVDFVSIAIKRIDWNNCETNLAGLYVNQAMYNTNMFTKQFVGEIDVFDTSKNRITVQLTKQQVQSLIAALIELDKNL